MLSGEARVDPALAIEDVAGLLDERGWRYALAGALALSAHGFSRATQDVDLVVEREAQTCVVRGLEQLGYATLHVSDGFSNHLHPDPARGRVDLIYVDAATAAQLFAGCSHSVAVGSRRVPVPRAEHLVAMKVHAMKNDPTRTPRELADIHQLLTLPGLDRAEARGYFERAGLLERYLDLERFL